MTATPAPMRWDLQHYYDHPEDPRIEADLARARQAAESLRERYLGRVATLDGAALAAAFGELEPLMASLERLWAYPFLLVSAGTPGLQALQDRLQSATAECQSQIQFFRLELQALGQAAFEALLTCEPLAGYRHYLMSIRAKAAHTLSEPEERMAALKDVNGTQAWQQLYNTILNSARPRLGETETTMSEANALLAGPDRARREAASRAMSEALVPEARTLGAIFNAVIGDRAQMLDARGYTSPLQPLLEGDGLAPEAIHAMLEAIESRFDLVQRYYRLKARAMGLDDFGAHDVTAPVGQPPAQVPFETARTMILTAFERFSPRLGALAEEFFTGRYIDVYPASGKRAMEFCIWTAGIHPYVLLNYTGQLSQVLTAAHELGHGTHYASLYQQQTPLNMRPNIFNEVPSTFAETLVSHWLEQERPAEERQALRATRIENAIHLIFVQTVLARWELDAYARRQDGPLTPESLGDAWESGRAKLYGDTVQLPPWTRHGWMRHAQAINYPLNVILYPFGLLTVFALFQRYLEQGEAFVPRYMAMLEAGLAPPVDEVLGMAGVDLRDPTIWAQGLRYLESLVDAYEAGLAPMARVS